MRYNYGTRRRIISEYYCYCSIENYYTFGYCRKHLKATTLVQYNIFPLGWRERNQKDETNLMFIIKLLSQHVSGIMMPIIRRTRVCTAAYGVLHWLWWLWLCGAGTQAVCTVKVTVRLSNLHSAHSLRPTSTQPQPSQPVQNTICGSAHSCSPDDGHNDARNMLR